MLSTGSQVELSREYDVSVSYDVSAGLCSLTLGLSTTVGRGLVLPTRAFFGYPMARLQG